MSHRRPSVPAVARTPSAEYLILDIETIPDTERWQRPAAGHGEPGFPPTWAHRIVVVGCLWLDHGYRLKRFGVIGERPAEPAGDGPTAAPTADEREHHLLDDFARFVGRARPVLVTYNGRSFDLPVIVMRSLCHAIALPWYYRDRDVRYRYSEDGHLDLCDWLADHGATRAGKLDAVARLIGLPGKLGVDGSQVEGLYRAGQLAKIQSYCLADVVQTAFVLLRFRLLQGVLSPSAYRAAAAALLDALAGEPRVADVVQAIDRDELLACADQRQYATVELELVHPFQRTQKGVLRGHGPLAVLLGGGHTAGEGELVAIQGKGAHQVVASAVPLHGITILAQFEPRGGHALGHGDGHGVAGDPFGEGQQRRLVAGADDLIDLGHALLRALDGVGVLCSSAGLRDELPEEINTAKPESSKAAAAFQRTPSANPGEDSSPLQIPFLDDFREARREFERAYIERCLIETGGNVTRAAEKVGMHRQSLQQKLKDLGLTRRYVLSDEAQDSDDE